MFYRSDRAHTLHLARFFRFWFFHYIQAAAVAVGMWDSLVLGFPHFHRLIIPGQILLPESLHLQFVHVEAGDG